jgi:magnesium transporter
MLHGYRRQSRELSQLEPSGVGELPAELVWIDMHAPTPEETRWIERACGLDMPTREEMREIEASARVYEESDALVLTATLLVNADTAAPATTEVTFILKNDRLLTLRYADPQPFRTLKGRLERYGAVLGSSLAIFFWLVDAVVARLADILERATADVDALSDEIFRAAGKHARGEEQIDLVAAIGRIGRSGDTASKVRESLHTLQRIMLSVATTERFAPTAKKEARARAKAITRDLQSLSEHAGFLSGKCNFLLDATLGLINIQQTNIIKIFSVLAIVFLPPTLIASIYGMNFAFMPELQWRLGYPFSILLMVLSAALPFLFFRRKGWL